MRPANGIRVGRAGRKGRGVFATKHFLPGDPIERAPLIVIEPDDVVTLTDSIVERYWYEMDDGGTALGLGFTSLYNHSSRANAVYDASSSDRVVYIEAYREIQSGAEITINYNGDPNSRSPVNFSYDLSSEDYDGTDTRVHYLDDGEWGQEGWVWCGTCDVQTTTAPALVTCTGCKLRMLAERSKLVEWSPESNEVVTRNSLLRMMDHTIQRLSMDGHQLYADVVREAVRVVKKRDGDGA
jgi:hypothetical protein